MSRFPQIQTGPGTWRVVAKGLAIIILTSIKCHFSPRIFPTAIEFQVRIKLICWRCELVLDFMLLFWIDEPNNNLLSTLSILSAQWCFIFNVCKNVHFAFYTSKRKSFKVAKHFRTAHVPAAERFHTWKYRGINILFIRFPFLKLITHPGKWCSVEENSFVEWSCLLGLPKARQRSFSEGNLRRIGPGMILIIIIIF